MSYERRLISYGVRDETGQVILARMTPRQLRRVKHKNWNRPYRPPEISGTSPAAVVQDEIQPGTQRWTIGQLLGPGAVRLAITRRRDR